MKRRMMQMLNGVSDICKFYVDLVEDLRERGF